MTESHWFPMYVTYHREERIKHHLDDFGIENFLPMKPGGRSDAGSAAMVPAIRNIIFVHTSFDLLSDLKQFREEYAPMQFVTCPSADGSKNTVLTVSDRQMRNFMFAYSLPPDKWFFVDANDTASTPAQEVEFVEGDCAGIRGTLRRIKGNRRVIVRLAHYASIAIRIDHSKQIKRI